jgi:hypothetical protein
MKKQDLLTEDEFKHFKEEWGHDKDGYCSICETIFDKISNMVDIKNPIKYSDACKGDFKKADRTKCMMHVKGKCKSDYNKGDCTEKDCPYKFGGEFAMAMKDKKNWRKNDKR